MPQLVNAAAYEALNMAGVECAHSGMTPYKPWYYNSSQTTHERYAGDAALQASRL